jgi:4-amino-4-deoxy-L-arabinose transferase-like glycosyltransferase
MTLPRVLGLLFVVALAFRMASAVGLIASDDLGYSMFAEAIRDGVFEPTAHHYAFRYAVTLAVAAVYSVCGISEWSMVAVPLLCSTLSVVLLWSIANRLYGVKVAWVAAGLLATFPLSLHYASILVPEPVAVCYSLLGVWLCLRAMSDRSFAMAAAAGFVFGAGVLAKEPVAFLGLAFGGSAVVNRNWRVVGGLALGVAIVAGGEMTYHFLVSGDPLLRIHSLKLHEASPMAIAANEHLSYRVFRAYPRMMLVPSLDFGVHSVLALGAGALAWWCWSGRHRMLLALWTILPWAYINFGSSSFDHYFVLPLGSR